MSKKPTVLLKIGGRAAEPEPMTLLAGELARLSDRYTFIFVHGGGAEVSRISGIFGLTPQFVNGVRMTTAPEMEVVDMVLAGKMNKEITRLFRKQGLNALGLSGSDGGLFTGKALSGNTHTGNVTAVNAPLLALLSGAGYVPVISSTSMETTGKSLNINADEAALALAEALPADILIFISDIPGVLVPASGGGDPEVLPVLDTPGIRRQIEAGVITGGMIPKVESSAKALDSGVKAVVIGDYRRGGDLKALIEGRKGTKIIKQQGQTE